MSERRMMIANGGIDNFPPGTSVDFDYMNQPQDIILSPGLYKFQVWGAQGGSSLEDPTYEITSAQGGKGGYSEGDIFISGNTAIQVRTGGMGTSTEGGYNGGGSTSGSSMNGTVNAKTLGVSKMAGGGGATDIRLSDGSLYSRMIVAGGGGGGVGFRYYYETTGEYDWDCGYSSSVQTDNLPTHVTCTSYKTVHCRFSDNQNLTVGKVIYVIISYEEQQSNMGTRTAVFSNGLILNHSSFTEMTSTVGRIASYISGPVTITSDMSYIDFYCTINKSGSQPPSFSGYLRYDYTHMTVNSFTSIGKVGGGTNGGGSYSNYIGTQNKAGKNGSFGNGASHSVTTYKYCAGAGGGGWYGGGSDYSNDSRSYVYYSGGGSGFVNTFENTQYRPEGYIGLEFENGITYNGNTSFPSPNGDNETGHTGNGYARISKYIIHNLSINIKDNNNLPLSRLNVILTSADKSYNLETDSNGNISKDIIEGEYNIICAGYELSLTNINILQDITINITATEITLYEFDYTGSVEDIMIIPGTYRLECWGASGGSYNSTYHGGYGGYSVGEITFIELTKLYISTGGSGPTSTGYGLKSGGFNGGGSAYGDANYSCGSGGGASDIRIGSTSFYSRVIVAGGGGGYATQNSGLRLNGGSGGGITGSAGEYKGSTTNYPGYGGSQTERGSSSYGSTNNSSTYGYTASFGIGGGRKGSSVAYIISGGGGGWYGGGYGSRSGAGGGSGYVYTADTASNYPSGCLLNSSYYLSNAETISGNDPIPSPSGGTETGHSGNGFVRITKLS